jgi:hypothetical protein
MKTTQRLILTAAITAMSAAPAMAEPTRIATEGAVPEQCRHFLDAPTGGSAWLQWSQRLSVASCEESAAVLPKITSFDELRSSMASFEHTLQAPIAIYRDAMAHGPTQIQISAAYRLGLSYVAILVRAREAIQAPADFSTNPASADKYLSLRQQIEPVLAEDGRQARAAFTEADRLATAFPADASANELMKNITSHAREQLASLRGR